MLQSVTSPSSSQGSAHTSRARHQRPLSVNFSSPDLKAGTQLIAGGKPEAIVLVILKDKHASAMILMQSRYNQ